jgi:hypothetical protein
MLSDIIVKYPGETFFVLSEDEWKNAILEYPELLGDKKYFPMSATAAIRDM